LRTAHNNKKTTTQNTKNSPLPHEKKMYKMVILWPFDYILCVYLLIIG